MSKHRAHARYVRVVRRHNQHLGLWRVASIGFLALAVGLVLLLAMGPLLGVSEVIVVVALYVSAMRADGKL